MNRANVIELKNLCSKIGDGLHGTPIYTENSGYYFINGNNLKDGSIVITENTKQVGEEEYRKNYIEFDKNTLFLSINGTLGSLAKYNGETIILGKSAAYIKCKKVNVDFLYYYLQLKNVQLCMYNIATGSTIKNLSLESIRTLPIPCPETQDQEKIAAVLSTIDAKIQTNSRINAELEAMAKTLYDYWFVQFDFPDANGKPYKSSGGKMEYNPTLKRNIPAGWEVKDLSKIAHIKKGVLITENTAVTDGDIKVISAGIDCSYYHNESNYPSNTITISASGANAGFINFWREPIFACDCTVVRGKTDQETLIILHFLKMRQEYLYKQARGSAQPHVYPKDIEALKMEVPPIALLNLFGESVLKGNEKIAQNIKENTQLTQLRDWLLPMLMNGQVKVA